MPNYLVESYAAHRHPVVDDACERARQVGQLEDGVRYVRTTFIPEDETILHLFEASSTEALQRALRLAPCSTNESLRQSKTLAQTR